MKFEIDLPKAYEPDVIEHEIYKFWEENDLFNPDTQVKLGLLDSSSPKFCITLPPPNVTGVLHLGHAITIAIEDLMTRYERMTQKQTLFLPGSDHAGIATQNVVERELKKQGINRKEIGRESFIEKTWEWKHKYHGRITEQSKRLGISCDWSREKFTLNPDLSLAVRTAFVRLFKKNFIYRGNYLVNWCPGRCESAISDLESIPEEIKSSLWYIRYPIINENFKEPQNKWGSGKWSTGANEFIEIATTRPETLLGDTAIATHSKHKKYKKLIGKKAILPVNGRIIDIIEDAHVDPEFGTGAVKVTPAHDPNDYEIGKRHNLDFITVMTKSGKMISEYSGKYSELDRFEARKQLVEDLEKEGLLVKVEDYSHSVGHCERCHTIIEPRISTQWFVKTKNLAEKALDKVKLKETTILPEREEKRFIQWMENIRDWCISRQLWWGHRIPVWYCDNNHQTCELEDPDSCIVCGSTNIRQDEDVLDTWFSSGLWTFSTLGWPDTDSKDYKRYYSTDMRETGYDILFFWVAREMMLGLELTGKIPYKTVYFHGIIRNETGKKISKSMENIEQYDPLNIIKEFGADSLRFTLISNAVPGLDINLDPRQLEASHKFCNKIWQSTRYVLMQIEEGHDIPRLDIEKIELHITDKWILSKLQSLLSEINDYMANHEYLKSTRDIKNFFWNVFCDWYLESTKTRIYGDKDKTTPKIVLFYVLETCLKLLHPIIPHLTEVLWQSLPNSIKSDKALIIAKWPKYNKNLVFSEEMNSVSIVFDIVTEIRRIRSEFNVALNKIVPLIINSNSNTLTESIKILIPEIVSLAKVDGGNISFNKEQIPKNSARIVVHGISAFVPLDDVIDKDAEYKRIKKKTSSLEKQINSINKKLAGPFSEKASAEVVQKEQDKLTKYKNQLKLLLEKLEVVS